MDRLSQLRLPTPLCPPESLFSLHSRSAFFSCVDQPCWPKSRCSSACRLPTLPVLHHLARIRLSAQTEDSWLLRVLVSTSSPSGPMQERISFGVICRRVLRPSSAQTLPARMGE